MKKAKSLQRLWAFLLVFVLAATTLGNDSMTVTAAEVESAAEISSEPASDATWTTIATPSGISYSWTGASSTSSTATVEVSSVNMGYNGDHTGTKDITVEVSLSGYTSGSATATLGRYGKSYYNGQFYNA